MAGLHASRAPGPAAAGLPSAGRPQASAHRPANRKLAGASVPGPMVSGGRKPTEGASGLTTISCMIRAKVTLFGHSLSSSPSPGVNGPTGP